MGFSVPTKCRFSKLIRNASGSSPSVSVTQRHRSRLPDVLPGAKTLYHASRIHIERVETMAASHEKTVSLAATKTKIGAPLGQRDAANRMALRIEDHHPIEGPHFPFPNRPGSGYWPRHPCHNEKPHPVFTA